MKTITRKFRTVAFAMLGLFFTATAFANAPAIALSNGAEVAAVVSQTDVQIAEPFQVELTVTAPSGSKVALPAISDQLGEFDVLNTQDIADVPSDVSADQRIWRRRMTLESITAGDLQVPALEIQVADGTESQAFTTLSTQPITVRVLSVLEGRADPTQFRDIQSVVDVYVPQPESYSWFWWSLGGMGTASIAAAAIAMVARRQTWLTPVQWATRELDSIQSSAVTQSKYSESISQELSTVLRDFLELQFEISAPVQTTKELLSEVDHRKILQPELTQRYSKLFAVADEAKFAGLSLTESQLSRMIDEARSIIIEACLYEPEPETQTESVGEDTSFKTSDPYLDSRSKQLPLSATSNRESV